MPCSVEAHSEAGDIDAALLTGESARSVAARYDVPTRTMQRHAARCLPKRLREALEAAEVAPLTPEQLIGRVAQIERKALQLVAAAENERAAIRDRASALRELRSTVELLSKLSFAAIERPVVERADEDLDARIRAAIDGRLGGDEPGAEPGPPLALRAGEPIDEAELVEE